MASARRRCGTIWASRASTRRRCVASRCVPSRAAHPLCSPLRAPRRTRARAAPRPRRAPSGPHPGLSRTRSWTAQYDLCLAAFERALALASDVESGDVWYNVGQVAIGIGDLGLAYQAFKVAISVDANHVESYANLVRAPFACVPSLHRLPPSRHYWRSGEGQPRTARRTPHALGCSGSLACPHQPRGVPPFARQGVLELRKGNVDAARANFQTAQEMAPYMFEPFFNGALLAFKLGDFQESYDLASKAVAAFPEHHDSHELLRQLRQQFAHL